jgi:hypothetical protein
MMKTFLAFALPALCMVVVALPAAGQRGGGRASALGGRMAPTGALSRPLGGFAGVGAGASRGLGRAGVSRGLYPYGYSYYIPGYFDDLDSGYSDPYYGYGAAPPAVPAYAPVPGPPVAPQQPVIINQYFGVQGPQGQANGPAPSNEPQAAAGGPLGSPQNYYLIAYKNHAIYSALAYWVEDKTLHYVTTQNTHNQASLDLIDLTLTKNLNQANDVPFSIPGQ